MKSSQTIRRDNKVSIASKDELDIKPIVYSFIVPKKSSISCSVNNAVKPPYWIRQDNAFGVIWTLFHKDKNDVGITQLEWCLKFVLNLKNSQGEYTGDVNICIQKIQDHLIDQYAKLSGILEKSVDTKKSSLTDVRSNTVGKESQGIVRETKRDFNEKVTYAEDNENGNESTKLQEEDGPMVLKNSTHKNIDYEEEKEENETFYTVPSSDIIAASTPIEEETFIFRKMENQKDKIISGGHCDSVCGSSGSHTKKKEFVSFTYNDMISKGPALCTKSSFVENLFDGSTYFDALTEETLNELFENEDQTDTNGTALKAMNKSEFVNFLNSSKKRQVEKIQKETERLDRLEKLLEDINTNRLSTYIPEELAKRLHHLQGSGIMRRT